VHRRAQECHEIDLRGRMSKQLGRAGKRDGLDERQCGIQVVVDLEQVRSDHFSGRRCFLASRTSSASNGREPTGSVIAMFTPEGGSKPARQNLGVTSEANLQTSFLDNPPSLRERVTFGACRRAMDFRQRTIHNPVPLRGTTTRSV
jgi:hypothetical protein